MTVLVLDTNIVASAFFWDGNPRRLLNAGYGGQAALITSSPLLAELRSVLSRPKFQVRISVARQSVGQLVETYAQRAVLVKPVPTPRIVSDPDDDVVIGTALAAKAGFIVTGDHALLAVTEYQGVRIVTATEAVQILTAA